MKKYRNDIILIVAILVVAGLVFLGINIFKAPGAAVSIQLNGSEKYSFPLEETNKTFVIYADGELEELTGETAVLESPTEKGANLVVIKDGIANVTDADCPDKLCVHQGEINSVGQSIICLPHKLTVTIIGEKADHTPDAIVQ